MFSIRPYHPSDLPALYRICLQTGDSGQDASLLYTDPELLGHIYAGPYAVMEPELCFVLTQAGSPCGYVLGTRDSMAFAERCEAMWFPVLRQRYPLPEPQQTGHDAAMIRLLHRGHSTALYPEHPAELHIDLLPVAQGQGLGRQLMERFIGRLRELGCSGVHLGVGKRNPRAISFYQRLGFRPLEEHDRAWTLGLRL